MEDMVEASFYHGRTNFSTTGELAFCHLTAFQTFAACLKAHEAKKSFPTTPFTAVVPKTQKADPVTDRLQVNTLMFFGKENSMSITVHRNKRRTRIRVQIGELVITLEIPV